jgi:hypothetical protein
MLTPLLRAEKVPLRVDKGDSLPWTANHELGAGSVLRAEMFPLAAIQGFSLRAENGVPAAFAERAASAMLVPPTVSATAWVATRWAQLTASRVTGAKFDSAGCPDIAARRAGMDSLGTVGNVVRLESLGGASAAAAEPSMVLTSAGSVLLQLV